jgi:hypothetical protein
MTYSETGAWNNLADQVFAKVIAKTPVSPDEAEEGSPPVHEVEQSPSRGLKRSISKSAQKSSLVQDAIGYDSLDTPLIADFFGVLDTAQPNDKKLSSKEDERCKKWTNLSRKQSENQLSLIHRTFASKKLVPRVEKGIPHAIRGAVWAEMVGQRSGLYTGMSHCQIEAMEEQLLDIYRVILSYSRTFL